MKCRKLEIDLVTYQLVDSIDLKMTNRVIRFNKVDAGLRQSVSHVLHYQIFNIGCYDNHLHFCKRRPVTKTWFTESLTKSISLSTWIFWSVKLVCKNIKRTDVKTVYQRFSSLSYIIWFENDILKFANYFWMDLELKKKVWFKRATTYLKTWRYY